MGEVIRKTADVEDIIEDVGATVTNATARGGRARALADETIGPVATILTAVEEERRAALAALGPLAAALATADDVADGTIGRIGDESWNAMGRPAADPTYALLFPGGIAAYTDAPVEEQPDLMDLLGRLFGLSLYPKLTDEQRARWQSELAEGATALRRAVEAQRPAAVRVRLLERVRRSVARVGQMRLVALKRSYKNEGMSETEIHAIIPDASRPRPVRRPPTDTPA